MTQSKKDIKTVEDIKLMVDGFYARVNDDALLSPIFNGFAEVDWEHHLPTMYGFWSKMLLGEGGYTGSPFPKHIPLPIDESHFDQWLSLFNENMDELFEGNIASDAKQRAYTIAYTFRTKLEYLKKN